MWGWGREGGFTVVWRGLQIFVTYHDDQVHTRAHTHSRDARCMNPRFFLFSSLTTCPWHATAPKHASRPTITSTVIDLLLFVIKLHLCDGGEVIGSSKRGDGRTDGRTEGGAEVRERGRRRKMEGQNGGGVTEITQKN